jgi:hypothetical protein
MGTRILKITMVMALCTLVLGLAPGCEGPRRGGVIIGSPAPPPPPPPEKGPPPWAPAHGYRAKHLYHYYPSHSVYYDTGRGVYFYLEGDGWRFSAALPSHIHLGYADYVTLELETDRPYEYFSEHKRKYPPGQAKKYGGKSGKKNKW